MKLSYKPLWKLMIDRDITRDEFIKNTKISKSTFYKMKANKNITTDVLLKICEGLKCDINDIINCEDNNG